jgi:hypothetical protein
VLRDEVRDCHIERKCTTSPSRDQDVGRPLITIIEQEAGLERDTRHCPAALDRDTLHHTIVPNRRLTSYLAAQRMIAEHV